MRTRWIRSGATALAAALFAGTSAFGGELASVPAKTDASSSENGRLAGTTYGWTLAVSPGAKCEESWSFTADGVMTVVSGEEVTTHRFALSAVAWGSVMALAQTRLTSNGRPDCQGTVNAAVGQSTQVFLQFLNGGGFFTCSTTDTMSCYGVATPLAVKPKDGAEAH